MPFTLNHHRSRERDRDRNRNRSHSRDRIKGRGSREEPNRRRQRSTSSSEAKGKHSPKSGGKRFWDGFRWIEGGDSSESSSVTGVKVQGKVSVPVNPSVEINQRIALLNSSIVGPLQDRRIWVGNLPLGSTNDGLKSFFNSTLEAIPGAGTAVGAVVSVWISSCR
jgi:hypothetical protein